MKQLRIGMNGCGRLGRAFLRQYLTLVNPRFTLVVMNDLMAPDQLEYLMRFDSVHGRLADHLTFQAACTPDSRTSTIHTSHGAVVYLQQQDCPLWQPYNLDYVVDFSGAYTHIADARQHLSRGAARALITAPLLDRAGVMCRTLPADACGLLPGACILAQPESAHLLSTYSCTTQALVTLLKPLMVAPFPEMLSIMVTELHGFTSGQALVDQPHQDWRRGRSAFESIIPTQTQGIFGVEYFLPGLLDKLAGYSVRVPMPNVAAVNICVHLKTPVSLTQVLNVLSPAAQNSAGRLAIDTQPTVSCDYIGRTESAVLAADLCEVKHHLLRLYAWYDNEYGYARRILESLHGTSL